MRQPRRDNTGETARDSTGPMQYNTGKNPGDSTGESLLFSTGQTAVKLSGAEAADRAQCAAPD